MILARGKPETFPYSILKGTGFKIRSDKTDQDEFCASVASPFTYAIVSKLLILHV